METTEEKIGMKTYTIEIPGRAPVTLTGTPQACWERVARELVGTDSGTVPVIREHDAPAQVQPAQVAPPQIAEPAPAPETHAQAVAAGVSVAGCERSTIDLIAAQAAGFAPARPYYDRGTPVIGLGVANARKSAREHEAKPRVAEAVDAFVSHVQAEHRRDVTLPITSLAMRSDGAMIDAKGEVYRIEPAALAQLGSRLGIEQPSYLLGVWPELRARNWNQWLATSLNHEASTCPNDHPARVRVAGMADKDIVARVRNGSGPASIWAVVGTRYGVYDVDTIALALKAGMATYPDARCEIEYNGTGAKMDVLFHSNVAPQHYVAGEFFKVGMRVRTSDAGGGSIKVSLLLWQNLCLNLICIDVADFAIDAIRHLGDPERLAERFRLAVTQGEAKLQHFLRAWGHACEESLAETTGSEFKPAHLRLLDEMEGESVSEIDLLQGIFSGLGKAGQVSIGRDDLPGLLAMHALDVSGARQLAPVTRASVVNAVTRYAHSQIGRTDPARQAILESEAGALLVGGRGGRPLPLPFMPPSRQHVATV